MNQAALSFASPLHLNNMFFEHYHRWREPAARELLEIEKKWEADKAARP
jgi:hypothetical protein